MVSLAGLSKDASRISAITLLQAVIDDCQLAISKTTKLDDRDPNKAYLEIPNVWKLNPLELARLQLLAKWRQETAMGTKFSPFLCG